MPTLSGSLTLASGSLEISNGTITGPAFYTETIVNISSAQILNMGSSPIELLPQPGANKYYDIEKIIFEFTQGTDTYSNNDNYQISTSITGNQIAIIEKWFMCNGYDEILILHPNNAVYKDSASNALFSTPMGLNNAIVFGFAYMSGTGDLGTLRVKIYHKTITFGT